MLCSFYQTQIHKKICHMFLFAIYYLGSDAFKLMMKILFIHKLKKAGEGDIQEPRI